jgi:hypothetical protein
MAVSADEQGIAEKKGKKRRGKEKGERISFLILRLRLSPLSPVLSF